MRFKSILLLLTIGMLLAAAANLFAAEKAIKEGSAIKATPKSQQPPAVSSDKSTPPVVESKQETTTQPQLPEPVTPVPQTTGAAAGPKAGEEINWWVLSGGGGRSTMGSFILGSTIGQTAVGPSSMGSYQLYSGFWQNFGRWYICGDADASGDVNMSDAVFMVSYIFTGGPAPNPPERFDVDCSGDLNVSDIVYLITYMFADGPAPCAAC